MKVSQLRVGSSYQLTTKHLGVVLVTVTKINPTPEPNQLGLNGRWTPGAHLGRVFCHSQNIFYPVDLADLRPIK